MVKKILNIVGVAGGVIGLAASWICYFIMVDGKFQFNETLYLPLIFTIFFLGISIVSLLGLLEKNTVLRNFAATNFVYAFTCVAYPIYISIRYNIGLLSGTQTLLILGSLFFAAAGVLTIVNFKKNNPIITYVYAGLFATGSIFLIITFRDFISILGIIGVVLSLGGAASLIFEGEYVPTVKKYSPKVDKDQVIVEKDLDESNGEPRYWKENGFTYADRP